MKKSKNHTRKLGVTTSMAAASALLEISYEAIQAAKNAGCKAIKPSGRVDCDALWAWLEKHPKVLEQAGDSVDREVEMALKTRADRLLRENRLARERGEWVPKVVVKQVWTKWVAAAKSRSFSSAARLVTLARIAPDAAAATQEVQREIADVWRSLESGDWFKDPTPPIK